MMLLKNACCEADFDLMCEIESIICKAKGHGFWQMHPGGLRYDRYLFGGGAMDVFSYGKLLYVDDTAVGYVLAYQEEGEFVLRLMPDYEEHADVALRLAEGCFEKHDAFTTIVNSNSHALCAALQVRGFTKEAEERYQAVLALDGWVPQKLSEGTEKIALLAQEDIPERALYADIPSGSEVTEEKFRMYLASKAYQTALEYVVRDRKTNAFIGFATWWVDENSKTALLEPVACLPEYRRRGIARRLLRNGLSMLKDRGIHQVFVSTSADHDEAIPLYDSLGFVKTGEANLYVKKK